MSPRLVRLGVRLALSRSPEHRWRQVAVPASTAVAVVLLLFAFGLVTANTRQQARDDGRTAISSSAPRRDAPPVANAPTDLFAAWRLESYRGTQYHVVWIAPSSDTTPVLPPGVDRPPRQGEAFVSPALARAISSDPLLAARYPAWSLIGDEGVRSSDELLAYAAMPDGHPFPGSWTISRFGSAGPADMVIPFELEELPPHGGVVVGAVIFLVLPALIVLYLGVSSTSAVRDHRFAVIFHIGAPRRFLAGIAIVETLALALPAFAVGLGGWLVVAPHLGRLPVLRADPLAGDLVLTLPAVAIVAGALLVVLLAFSALGPGLLGSRAELRPRPGRSRPTLARLRLLPFATAIAVLFTRNFVSPAPAQALFAVALLLLLVGVPTAAPWSLRISGSLLAHLRNVPAFLAGRRLAWDPIRNARPHLAAALLIALTIAVTGYNAVVAQEIAPASTPSSAFAKVHSGSLSSDDFDAFAAEAHPALVVMVREESRLWTLGTTCEALRPQVRGLQCDPTDTRQFGPGDGEATAAALGGPFSVALDPTLDARRAEGSFIMVLDAATSPAELEVRVAAAAARTLPGSNVSGNASSFRGYYAPEQSWVTAGLAAAGVVLGLGTVVPIIDRLMATRRERSHLVRIGVTERWLRMLEVVLFSVPFLVVVAIGAAIGTTACWLWVNNGSRSTPMPWVPIAVILSAAIAAGLLGSVVAGTAAARVASRQRGD